MFSFKIFNRGQSLQFLSAEQAKSEFNKSTYIQQMTEPELKYRSVQSKTQLLTQYQSAVLDFSSEEQAMIKWYFQLLFDLLTERATKLLPKGPICLIKIDSELEWGMPYTINQCIVLPVKVIQSMNSHWQTFQDQLYRPTVVRWNPVRPQYYSVVYPTLTLLLHELIHLYQRNKSTYGDLNGIFDDLYQRAWRFTKIKPNQLSNLEQIFSPQGTLAKAGGFVVSNPDAPNLQWIAPVWNHSANYWVYFLPLLVMMPSKSSKPIGILYRLKQTGQQSWALDHTWYPLDQMRNYLDRFYVGGVSNARMSGLSDIALVHPNEVMAHLLSNYVLSGHIMSQAEGYHLGNPHQTDYFDFYRLINKYVINDGYVQFRDR